MGLTFVMSGRVAFFWKARVCFMGFHAFHGMEKTQITIMFIFRYNTSISDFAITIFYISWKIIKINEQILWLRWILIFWQYTLDTNYPWSALNFWHRKLLTWNVNVCQKLYLRLTCIMWLQQIPFSMFFKILLLSQRR